MDDLEQTTLDELGPIDFFVIEFPESHLTGEGLLALVELVDRGIIRVLDLVFVERRSDGTTVRLHLDEQDHRPVLAQFTGASSGLVGDDDLTVIGEILEPGTWAAVLVYENTWAAPLGRALRRAGGQLVAGGRIPVQAILAVLDDIEADSGTDHRLVERA
ncbi:DUF6325 family protein [Cryptosporangium aurantiacum]|uniref:DUF1269 domain-containing protein n=1 Tax=Cryptosporangium aurantiacum TaxID=134849 RepID=A0A1M7RFP8_9ACTN|nr:DUF6325 family protein [Cryptosporangium aurantiacum]SHN45105.1 hypothetical protein SAMN05443668_111139 [Cryptosporangium aurantiacum]